MGVPHSQVTGFLWPLIGPFAHQSPHGSHRNRGTTSASKEAASAARGHGPRGRASDKEVPLATVTSLPRRRRGSQEGRGEILPEHAPTTASGRRYRNCCWFTDKDGTGLFKVPWVLRIDKITGRKGVTTTTTTTRLGFLLLSFCPLRVIKEPWPVTQGDEGTADAATDG